MAKAPVGRLRKRAMGANIKYKDSVFSALFSDPAILKDTI
jgi:hypothetical protein